MKNPSTFFCVLICTLLFSVIANAETEPNNFAQNANSSTLGANETGQIHASTDNVDWFKFNITGTGSLNISLTSVIVANVNYFLVELFHAEDTANRVAYAYLSSTSSISFATMPGLYYLRFGTYNNEGSYSFSTAFTSTLYAADAGEQNGNVNAAVNVSTNPFTGAIGHYAGVLAMNAGFSKWDVADWWTLLGPSGSLSFFVEKDAASSLYVEVYDSSNTNSGSWLAYAIMLQDTSTLKIANGSGKYKIKVSNASTYGSYRITYSSTTGIATKSVVADITQLFPNPTRGVLTIRSEDIVDNIEINNLLGEQVFSFTNYGKEKSMEIDLAEQQPGVYFVKLFKGERTVIKRIILD